MKKKGDKAGDGAGRGRFRRVTPGRTMQPGERPEITVRCADYNLHVGWSEEDQVYVARVDKYSLLAAHGDTPEEALKEIRSALRAVLEEGE